MVNVNIIFISSYKMHIMMFIMKHWKIYDDRKGNMENGERGTDGAERREWEVWSVVFWLFHYIIYLILSLHLIFSFCFIITLLHRGRVFYIIFLFSFWFSIHSLFIVKHSIHVACMCVYVLMCCASTKWSIHQKSSL